jgi:spermidine synthase
MRRAIAVPEIQNAPPPGRLLARVLPAVVGWAAVTGQVLLLREFMVLFNGNELSTGIVLAAWLAFAASGALVARWLPRSGLALRISIAVIATLCGASLPVAIWLLRTARFQGTAVTGELLGPAAMLQLSVAHLAPFCALSGCLFALSMQLLTQTRNCEPSSALARAYALESAGSAIGGFLAAVILLRFLGPFEIVFLVFGVCLWSATALFSRLRFQLLAIAVSVLSVIESPHLETASQQRPWGDLHVLATRDSPYGRITVTEAGAMRTVYEDGSVVANIPDPASAEEAVHFALLEHPNPRRVLLIGGTVNGSIPEALKHHSVAQLDAVELDPALTKVFRVVFPAESALAFADPRVSGYATDGRRFLETTPAHYDAIVVNVPEPDTAQWNRFFTAEFFHSARRHLATGGILAISVRSSEEYISPQRAAFLRCIHRTLAEAFPHIAVIPGDPVHMIASVEGASLTEDPAELVSRLHARSLDTRYVREYMLPYRLSQERRDELRRILDPLPATPINRDFHPIAYFFDGVLWSAQFNTRYAATLQTLATIPFARLLAAAALLGALLVATLAIIRRPSRPRAVAAWTVTTSGFSLMTVQLLLLLAFQSIYGYVYSELALLIGLFMAGIGAGAGLALRFRPRPANPIRGVAAIQWIVAVSAPLVVLAAAGFAHTPVATGAAAAIGFPAGAFLFGIPGGMQFPFAAALWFGAGPAPAQRNSAALYAFDLLGGCAGALILAAFLVPVYGFWNTAWLSAVLAAAPALAATALACRQSSADAPAR